MAAIKFTDTYVKNLKPTSGKQIEVTDATGLMLRVSPGGTRTWVYRYMFEGTRRRLTLGTYPSMTLADARAEYAKADDKRKRDGIWTRR